MRKENQATHAITSAVASCKHHLLKVLDSAGWADPTAVLEVGVSF
jgi:hypothetical protein